MPDGCLEPEVVESLLAGQLDAAAVERVFEHVDGCANCRVLLSVLARDAEHDSHGPTAVEAPIATSETVADSSAGVGTRRAAPGDAPPNQIDRYLIEKRLGSGGMGVVLLAEDTELKRKVVLKLLRSDMAAAGSRDRLLREAQAMARVSHPNVVPIYDVGVHLDRVYLVMELIDGSDLAAWLGQTRSVSDILRVFAAAGRGLASAHAAGLVHRDFKPHNVMIAKTGEVKVTDFGLARTDDATPAQPAPPERVPSVPASSGNAVASLLASPLTQTGAMVGTPAYMAPEQITGGPVDARTDQFSFCVALFEALEGERPFRGASAAEQFDATLSGVMPDLKRARGLPSRIVRALRRGLSLEPGQRFPTMDALLAELAPPARKGVAIAIGVAAVAIAGIVGVAVARRGGSAPETDPADVASAWRAARACIAGDPPAARELDLAIAARDVVTRTEDACDGAIGTAREAIARGDAASDAARAIRTLATAYVAHRQELVRAEAAASDDDGSAHSDRDPLIAAVTDVDAAITALAPDWRAAEPAAAALPVLEPKAISVDGVPVTYAGSRNGHMIVKSLRGDVGTIDWWGAKPTLRSPLEVVPQDRSWSANPIDRGATVDLVVGGATIATGLTRTAQLLAALGDPTHRIVVYFDKGAYVARSVDGGAHWSSEPLAPGGRRMHGRATPAGDRFDLMWIDDDHTRYLGLTVAAASGPLPGGSIIAAGAPESTCTSSPLWSVFADGGNYLVRRIDREIARFPKRTAVIACTEERAAVDVGGTMHACDSTGCRPIPPSPDRPGVIGVVVFREQPHPRAPIVAIWRDAAAPVVHRIAEAWRLRGVIDVRGTPMMMFVDLGNRIGLTPLP